MFSWLLLLKLFIQSKQFITAASLCNLHPLSHLTLGGIKARDSHGHSLTISDVLEHGDPWGEGVCVTKLMMLIEKKCHLAVFH